jgi:hypothetical protein
MPTRNWSNLFSILAYMLVCGALTVWMVHIHVSDLAWLLALVTVTMLPFVLHYFWQRYSARRAA